MKITVIIPAYNEEHYIGDTLRSVLKQNYLDIEIIVVDNGSTDRTKEKVKEFPSVLLLEETKRGVQHARERGRKEALGEIIANLDADCLPAPDWINNALSHFNNPSVVAVSGPYDYHDATKMFRIGSSFVQRFCFNVLHRTAYRLFGRGVFAMGGNIFIQAWALKKIDGYDTSIAFYGDDTDTANRLLSVGRVLYRNDVTVQSSARRFKKMGILMVFGKYIVNFFWVVIFKKPYHTKLLE